MVFTNSKKPIGNLLLYKQVLVFFLAFFKKKNDADEIS